MISALAAEIRGLDQKTEVLARENYPETTLLSQVPGVGSLTALAYVLTIEDPARLPRPRSVGSYLGLRSRQADSGKLKPQLQIAQGGIGPTEDAKEEDRTLLTRILRPIVWPTVTADYRWAGGHEEGQIEFSSVVLNEAVIQVAAPD